jgi:hypothetical protein
METEMRDLISRSSAFFTAKVGRCGTCMRQALAVALALWAVFGAGMVMWPDGRVQTLIGLVAFAFTALWLLHVAAYAARAVAETLSRDGQLPGPGMTGAAPARTELRVGRRHALGVLLRAAGVGVAVSVPVLLWPSDGFAFCGQCTQDADCGVGFVCRNTAAVNSGKVCNECVAS